MERKLWSSWSFDRNRRISNLFIIFWCNEIEWYCNFAQPLYKLCSYYLNIIYINRKVMQWYVLMSVALIWMIIDEWVYQLQNITNFANFLSNLINIPCDKQPSTSANRKCIRQWQENIIKDIIHTSIPNIEESLDNA